jgi:hypothetical protein
MAVGSELVGKDVGAFTKTDSPTTGYTFMADCIAFFDSSDVNDSIFKLTYLFIIIIIIIIKIVINGYVQEAGKVILNMFHNQINR